MTKTISSTIDCQPITDRSSDSAILCLYDLNADARNSKIVATIAPIMSESDIPLITSIDGMMTASDITMLTNFDKP